MDILFLLLLTHFVQYLRKEFPLGGIGKFLLGPVLLFLGRDLPKRRDHRNRLNFIERFISVCFGLSLPGWYSLACLKRKSQAGVNSLDKLNCYFCSTIYIGRNGIYLYPVFGFYGIIEITRKSG